MRRAWVVQGYGHMPPSGQWTQRVNIPVRAWTEAGALRKAKRDYTARRMGIERWKVRRIWE